MLNKNSQLDFLDLISMASFCIGLMNLDENITQGDMQDLQKKFNTKAEELLDEIHSHLENQDYILTQILQRLEKLENDK